MVRNSWISCIILLASVNTGHAQDGASNIEFVENKGQWGSEAKFKGEMKVGAFFLDKKGFTVLLHHPDDLMRLNGNHREKSILMGSVNGGKTNTAGKKGEQGPGAPETGNAGMDVRSHAYRMSFVGASDQAEIVPDKPLPSYNNYFIGKDSSKWAGNCRIFQGVTYKNMYPNVDVRYYSDKGKLKYDIIVHPGGNVDQIEMLYEGVDKLGTKKNQLEITTSVGMVKELAPYSFFFNENGKTEIGCKYHIRNGNTVKFKVDDHPDGSTLVIDPALVFVSFTGSTISNWGFTATPGPDGSFYAGGIVFGNAYPYNTGPLQPKFGGGNFDVSIMKFSSNGSNMLYSTFLGGGDTETPHSMICDPNGNLIVLGRTYSVDFPAKTRFGNGGGADMFVAKISAGGNQMLGCMRIGGSGDDCVNMADQVRTGSDKPDSLVRNYGDDTRSEVIVDWNNNIYVAASTKSSALTEAAGGFPIRGNVFQKTFGGGLQDGVVLKINPDCNDLLWSSFLGGGGCDAAFVLKRAPLGDGDLYVAGATTSGNFPGDKSNVIQTAYQGGTSDGFVTIISADGTTQKKTTFLGTGAGDAVYGIQVDKKGFPYVMGTTNGTWPVINAPYVNAGAKQFVSKMLPDLSGYVYSTTFGTPGARLPNISPVAFLVDRCENVYVSGWGGWILGGPDPYGQAGTLNMPITPDAIQKLTDNRDFYFIVLKKNVTDILYGTFLGQKDTQKSISEHVDGGTSRYDQNGIIYQAICANCNGGAASRFPTTPGVWAPANGSGANGCNVAAVKIAFNYAGVAAGMRASVNGRLYDTSGCIVMDAVFQDTVRNAKSYIWNFGDGGGDFATTDYIVSHTYNNPGIYTVMMVAIDENSCNGRDTTYRHVIARTDKAILDYIYAKAQPAICTSLEYLFTNQSQVPVGKPFTNTSFVWDFGDQTPQTPPMGLGVVDHTFMQAGTYNVKLLLVDTHYCNFPDTLTKTIRVSPMAKAQFVTPATGCAPYSAYFNNTSLGGVQFFWDFGDGVGTSTETNPTYVYQNPGTYIVKLLELDPTTCNKQDQTQFAITVSGKPTASFTFAPSPPVANTPIIFFNSSVGGTRFRYSFGDGDSAIKTSLDTTQHLYIFTDTFDVCLVAYNQFGCTDTACKRVATLIHPLLDVPNAFTPGRFGQNGIVKVASFGITRLLFRIYNRWGQLVFETNDPNQGWDGTRGGVLQPMDVYGYTVEADFSDGKHATKKGDITLIR
ncbi:DUF7948 domain-containing protein [Flavitalea flava]